MCAGSSFALSVVAFTGQCEHSTRAQVQRRRARTRCKSHLGNSMDRPPCVEDRRWQPELQSRAGCVLQYNPEAVDQNVTDDRFKVAILNHQRPIRFEPRLAANCPCHDQDEGDEPVAGESPHTRRIPRSRPVWSECSSPRMHSHWESAVRSVGQVSGFASDIKAGGTEVAFRQSSRKKSGVMEKTPSIDLGRLPLAHSSFARLAPCCPRKSHSSPWRNWSQGLRT